MIILIGCTEMEIEDQHDEHIYEIADNYVTFPYLLPHIEDYTIVGMYYNPQDEASETEEMFGVTYNADVFVTAEMEESMRNHSKKTSKINEDVGGFIYGPFYEAEEFMQSINLLMKRSPFEDVSPEKDRSELFRMEIEGQEVVYDYLEKVMTSHGNHSYFIFEVEKDGTFYRVDVELTSKMTKDEIEQEIKEICSAILL